jgi:predicted RNA binding protein YcfA (HicA-like mRNA interferase family)
MGRRARGVSFPRALRAFQRLGFEVDHVSGSHYVLIHADGRRVSLPAHRIVKPGLLLDLIKKSKLTWRQFEENL